MNPPRSDSRSLFAALSARTLFMLASLLAVGGASPAPAVQASPPAVASPRPPADVIPAALPTDPEMLSLSAVPEWALASTQREHLTEIGIGSGGTLDQATRYALQDVASRIAVSVESQLREPHRERNGTSVESLEHVIETCVTSSRFSGWERTRSTERAGVFWVEVRIDRRGLVRDSRTELVRVSNEVDAQLHTAGRSALRRLLAVQSTAPDRQRATSLMALLDVLDLDFEREPWEARRAEWRAIDAKARRALVFEVRSDSQSREIARWLESRLVAGRLRTRAGECIRDDAVCIDIRSELTEADVASRHMAKVRATVAIVEPDGSVVEAGSLVGRGDSKADARRARRNAVKDLHQNLASSSMLKGLIKP